MFYYFYLIWSSMNCGHLWKFIIPKIWLWFALKISDIRNVEVFNMLDQHLALRSSSSKYVISKSNENNRYYYKPIHVNDQTLNSLLTCKPVDEQNNC